MDKEFFVEPQLEYDPSFVSSMPTWQYLSTSMEIQTNPLLNDHSEYALSSMVTSSSASNSAMSTDNFMMRELIGKLGHICNSNDISSYIQTNNCSTNTSCYTTPLDSPPKMGISMPFLDNMVNENFPSIGLSSNLPAMLSESGYTEQAAWFSSFGSNSFNGRSTTTQSVLQNNPKEPRSCSNLSRGNSKLHRFSSSTFLNNNCMNHQGEFSGSLDNSTIYGQNQVSEIGSNKKRKSSSAKAKGKQSQIPIKVGENVGDERAKRSRTEENDETKTEENREDEDRNKKTEKAAEPLKDFIHVRARRGQATDSHSLAERVRREKISERMKLLQDLVPGCNQVTGKALMLEEIINYVQSLQRQVEFLSMKLSVVNPRLEMMNTSNLFSKDQIQTNCSMTTPHEQLHQNQSQSRIDPLNPTINQNNDSFHVPTIDVLSNCLPQLSSLCEGDLQSIVQMGFGPIENGFQAQNSNGTNPTPMKVEL